MKFTGDQQNAINIRNKNVLVSAAAGSGKTAVLVERIIRRVTDEIAPVDVDRLLVMTFTKAAAAQMRERILEAIEKLKENRPDDDNLRKQAALVHNAHIQTIDSFCLDVVRDHFHEIDLEPDFRIADEGELKLIEQDVLSEVLEKAYEEGNEDFLTMTESLSAKKTDSAIEDIIIKLHEFADSHPKPLEWLEACIKAYETADIDRFDDMPWAKEQFISVSGQLEAIKDRLTEIREICFCENGPSGYEEAIDEDLRLTEKLLTSGDYRELYERLREENFDGYQFKKIGLKGRIPKITDGMSTEEINEIGEKNRLKDFVKGRRDNCKKELTSILSGYKTFSPENICRVMKKACPSVRTLIKVTIDFTAAYNAQKKERNVAGFNDIEHFCLEILAKGKDTTARDYREHFEEIYVDEYQDSNFVQEKILKLLARESETEGNVFMVGDVKQSIYGFRQARPEIFTGKYNCFIPFKDGTDTDRDIRIDLSYNFRSRDTILKSINELFERVMTKEIGGIVYNDAAALHTGAEYPEYPGSTDRTEVILALRDDELDDKVLEAKAVADKIKKLIKEHKVTEKIKNEKTGEEELVYRNLRYSDIVILLRTTKDWDTVFARVLDDEGLPAHVMSSKGYFSAKEISDLLAFLKIIDNPLQDIPFAATLLSPLGGFTDEELAAIRSCETVEDHKRGLTLYESMRSFAGEGHLKNKCVEFLQELDKYRKLSSYTPVYELLSMIIDGGYGALVSAMPGGKQKKANLNMLLKKASDYGKTSYKGLFHFNRYIEALHKYDIDFGEASLLGENDDTVRIMSIHKSKGLEFPVCILSGMSKRMNFKDADASVVTDADLGIGVDYIDIEKRTKQPTFYKKVISAKRRRETLAEELRLFYVALTRAKEKLIMTGVIKEKNDFEDFPTLLKAASYLDIYKAAAEGTAMEYSDVAFLSTEALTEEKIKEQVNLEAGRLKIKKMLSESEGAVPELLSGEIKSRFDYKYPHGEKPGQYSKISVTELKRRSMAADLGDSSGDADETHYIYGDANDETKRHDNTAARHGTAVHRIFELWDYGRSCSMDSVSSFIDEVKEKKRIEADLAGLITAEEIYGFVNSDIAARMGQAAGKGRLRREQPFVIETDGMLVQGIIDAYFIEDDEIVVVDYKTDRVKDIKALEKRYKVQLDYYAQALNQLTDLPVKEKVIWSTCLNQSLTVS